MTDVSTNLKLCAIFSQHAEAPHTSIREAEDFMTTLQGVNARSLSAEDMTRGRTLVQTLEQKATNFAYFASVQAGLEGLTGPALDKKTDEILKNATVAEDLAQRLRGMLGYA